MTLSIRHRTKAGTKPRVGGPRRVDQPVEAATLSRKTRMTCPGDTTLTKSTSRGTARRCAAAFGLGSARDAMRRNLTMNRGKTPAEALL